MLAPDALTLRVNVKSYTPNYTRKTAKTPATTLFSQPAALVLF